MTFRAVNRDWDNEILHGKHIGMQLIYLTGLVHLGEQRFGITFFVGVLKYQKSY
jgi:hypothetical protein